MDETRSVLYIHRVAFLSILSFGFWGQILSRENMLRVRFSDEEFQRLKTLSDNAGLSALLQS
jgi:hypothetical protein